MLCHTTKSIAQLYETIVPLVQTFYGSHTPSFSVTTCVTASFEGLALLVSNSARVLLISSHDYF